MIEDEHQLVSRAKDGEAEAFGALYDYYLPRIYRFVLLKVSHREEAEDLTHQVFLKAWNNIGQFNFLGFSFGSWLYQIARNTTIDYYRKNDGTEVSLEEITVDVIGTDLSLENKIDKALEWEKLIKALKQLKDIEQDVLVMRFVEDMAVRQVAEAIGKTEGATKLIQHRAIKNLKAILES
ncbi:MAG: sigma-70 family RNA polymerase sigma factor [Candidatus Colwellbacteria bacterium]|nr:sigma-70 family RNA polymerase sigma factor [Candidatus Colwellbacteria bacterium]